MTEELKIKYEDLKNYFKNLGSVAIAFSSGVDSTLMLKVAHDVLGDKAVAITARSHSFPAREKTEAMEFCKKEGIEHIFIDSEELEIPGFKQNPKNRCYLCKHELFEEIIKVAKNHKLAYVCEGSNLDDNGDYRPGLQAVAELGVSPRSSTTIHSYSSISLSSSRQIRRYSSQVLTAAESLRSLQCSWDVRADLTVRYSFLPVRRSDIWSSSFLSKMRLCLATRSSSQEVI